MYKDKEKKRQYERDWYKKKKELKKSSNNRWRTKQLKIYRDIKAKASCYLCGENHPACLDFHHIDENTKSFNIASLAARCSMSKLEKEIQKCLTICANCHRKIHFYTDLPAQDNPPSGD